MLIKKGNGVVDPHTLEQEKHALEHAGHHHH
jgi:hypothetical protein